MTRQRVTALLMGTAAVLANLAFTALGSVFDYPDVLREPAEQILREFAARQRAIMTWFAVLALSAGLIAPIAVLAGRFTSSSAGVMAVWAGVLAAVVQVIGLSRWVLIVPGLAARGDTETFARLHTILGVVVGETLGYLFTALWTILVLREIGRRLAGWWFSWLGLASALLILLGVFAPLGLPVADIANFIGYVLWSIWLIAFAVILWRSRRELVVPQAPAGP